MNNKKKKERLRYAETWYPDNTAVMLLHAQNESPTVYDFLRNLQCLQEYQRRRISLWANSCPTRNIQRETNVEHGRLSYTFDFLRLWGLWIPYSNFYAFIKATMFEKLKKCWCNYSSRFFLAPFPTNSEKRTAHSSVLPLLLTEDCACAFPGVLPFM